MEGTLSGDSTIVHVLKSLQDTRHCLGTCDEYETSLRLHGLYSKRNQWRTGREKRQ